MKFLIYLLMVSAAAGEVPDAPSKILSKPFLAAHTAFLGATVYDVEMTHEGIAHHKCVEGNGNAYPSRGQLYKNDLIWFGAITAMDIGLKLASRHEGVPHWLQEIDGNIGAAIGTGKHLYGGTRWATECW